MNGRHCSRLSKPYTSQMKEGVELEVGWELILPRNAINPKLSEESFHPSLLGSSPSDFIFLSQQQ
jgi:hypothetical protein